MEEFRKIQEAEAEQAYIDDDEQEKGVLRQLRDSASNIAGSIGAGLDQVRSCIMPDL